MLQRFWEWLCGLLSPRAEVELDQALRLIAHQDVQLGHLRRERDRLLETLEQVCAENRKLAAALAACERTG